MFLNLFYQVNKSAGASNTMSAKQATARRVELHFPGLSRRSTMEKSKLMFLVLAICGTACMLAALVAITYLYHQHAPQFAEEEKKAIIPFVFFVGIPSAAGFVVGAVLVAAGVSIGLKDRA
jgi:hypothetical protein